MNGQNIYTKFAAYSTAGAMSIVLLGGFGVAPVHLKPCLTPITVI